MFCTPSSNKAIKRKPEKVRAHMWTLDGKTTLQRLGSKCKSEERLDSLSRYTRQRPGRVLKGKDISNVDILSPLAVKRLSKAKLCDLHK